MLKKVLKIVGVVLLLAVVGGASWAYVTVRSFDQSTSRVYDVPPPAITAATTPEALARGKHLAESIGGCATTDCHGTDLAGGKSIAMGPLGTLTGPNITPGGLLRDYSDGELARLVLHGLKQDGRSALFMPSQDFSWWPDDDVAALIGYLRSVPAVEKANGPIEVGLLGKILDRRDLIVLDVARRIDHANRPKAPPPEPTAAYGAFLARSCQGCHGEHLSGGKIPGAPSSMPIPTNLTRHETGLAKWTFADFERLLGTGAKPDGSKLDPFMPYEAFSKMNDVEKRALWAYLESLPPRPFGER